MWCQYFYFILQYLTGLQPFWKCEKVTELQLLTFSHYYIKLKIKS